jgi:hypothetical protein
MIGALQQDEYASQINMDLNTHTQQAATIKFNFKPVLIALAIFIQFVPN